MTAGELTVALLQQLEGPYKGYVITAVIVILTAVVTKFVFKTFKWLVVIIIMGALILGAAWILGELTNI